MLFKGVGYGKEIEYPHKEQQKAGRTQILPCVATLERIKEGAREGDTRSSSCAGLSFRPCYF